MLPCPPKHAVDAGVMADGAVEQGRAVASGARCARLGARLLACKCGCIVQAEKLLSLLGGQGRSLGIHVYVVVAQHSLVQVSKSVICELFKFQEAECSAGAVCGLDRCRNE